MLTDRTGMSRYQIMLDLDADFVQQGGWTNTKANLPTPLLAFLLREVVTAACEVSVAAILASGRVRRDGRSAGFKIGGGPEVRQVRIMAQQRRQRNRVVQLEEQ